MASSSCRLAQMKDEMSQIRNGPNPNREIDFRIFRDPLTYTFH